MEWLKLIFGLLAILSVAVGTPTRKVITELNPGCDPSLCPQTKNSSSHNLVYTKAEGPQDTIHYLWSTIGLPTCLVFLTSKNASMNINWHSLLGENSTEKKGAISFTEDPIYASALIISKLIEFDDPDDEGILTLNATELITSLENLQWDEVNDTIMSSTTHGKASFSTLSYNNNLLGDGVFNLNFDLTGLQEEHDEILPKLLRNSNCSQIKLKLNNLPSNFNNSRYGVEILLLSSENKIDVWEKTVLDLINDEYTPGVFTNVQLKSLQSKDGFGSYLTWKPIAYTSDELTVTDSTLVNFNDMRNNTEDKPFRKSIAGAYFDSDTVAQVFKVTFGSEKDGFYAKYKHVSWAFIYGIGVPTNETFSTLVIMTIACGTGIPVLLMLASSGYVLRLKYLKKKAVD